MEIVANANVPPIVLATAEAVNPNTFDSVDMLVAPSEIYIAKFVSPNTLNDDVYQVVHCVDQDRILYGVFLKPNGEIGSKADAKQLVPDQMREEVRIVARFIHDCPARSTKEQQIDAVQEDLNRLLDADSTTGVECIEGLVTQHTSEAQTYGNEEPEPVSKRLLLGLHEVYGDPDEEVAALISNALTDLRLLCDEHGLEFHTIDQSAFQHYLAERS